MAKRQTKRHNPEQTIRRLREADMMLAAGKTIGQVRELLARTPVGFRWTDAVLVQLR